MKVTSPKDTESGILHFEEAIKKFEAEFKKEDKDEAYYLIAVEDIEYNRSVCDKIEKNIP